MNVAQVSRDQFIRAIGEGDEFAKKYFLPHCTRDKLWGDTFGLWECSELMGAISLKTSGNINKTSNIKLLHTFSKHRGKGIGKALCNAAMLKSAKLGALYFRVSANPKAVEFYRKTGFKFWGKQRSGCELSVFKINGASIGKGIYKSDNYIEKCLNQKPMGGLIERYDKPK